MERYSNRAQRANADDEEIKTSPKHQFPVIASHESERRNRVPAIFFNKTMTKTGPFHMEKADWNIFSCFIFTPYLHTFSMRL